MDYWIWSLLIAVITYIVIKAREKKNYFRNYGIPQPEEIPFLGVMGWNMIARRHVGYVIKDLYNMNKEAKYIGVHSFLNPAVVVRDLELIKSVLVKNFDHFTDHRIFVDESSDPLFAKNLSAVNGDKWRELRNLLSPAFTASKMRNMQVLMSRCAENFVDQFVKKYKDSEAIDTKDAFTRYANDVIATCAFGIEVDSLKNPDNEFYLSGKRSTNFQSLSIVVKAIVMTMCPSLASKLGLRLIPKRESEFFLNLIESTIKTRDEQGINRPDMLQLLMESREKSSLDIMDMTAQAFVFFLGGFDTVSNQLCLLANELAIYPDVQEKLRAEIDEVMKSCDGRPTYETINNMAYLDAVFNETARMHPISFLSRMCSKEFELPPAVPGAKPFVVKRGIEVMIPSIGIHRDSDNYEDPEKFNPDRYLNKKVSSDVLNLAFGLGPRMCIASRFATLECKVLIVQLLAKCDLLPAEKTCHPMVYSRNSFTPVPEGGFWLKIKQRC